MTLSFWTHKLPIVLPERLVPTRTDEKTTVDSSLCAKKEESSLVPAFRRLQYGGESLGIRLHLNCRDYLHANCRLPPPPPSDTDTSCASDVPCTFPKDAKVNYSVIHGSPGVPTEQALVPQLLPELKNLS